MEEKTKERLAHILRDLRENNPGVEGTMSVSLDGLLLAHDFAEDDQGGKTLAIVITLLRLGEESDAIKESGGFDEIRLQGAERSVLLYRAAGAVLAVRIGAEANMGMIALEAQQAATEIGLALNSEFSGNRQREFITDLDRVIAEN